MVATIVSRAWTEVTPSGVGRRQASPDHPRHRALEGSTSADRFNSTKLAVPTH